MAKKKLRKRGLSRGKDSNEIFKNEMKGKYQLQGVLQKLPLNDTAAMLQPLSQFECDFCCLLSNLANKKNFIKTESDSKATFNCTPCTNQLKFHIFCVRINF